MREQQSLAGFWRFEIDPGDRGLAGKWWTRDCPDQITLPGSLQEQGFGEAVTPETEWTGSVFDRSWYLGARLIDAGPAGYWDLCTEGVVYECGEKNCRERIAFARLECA